MAISAGSAILKLPFPPKRASIQYRRVPEMPLPPALHQALPYLQMHWELSVGGWFHCAPPEHILQNSMLEELTDQMQALGRGRCNVRDTTFTSLDPSSCPVIKRLVRQQMLQWQKSKDNLPHIHCKRWGWAGLMRNWNGILGL